MSTQGSTQAATPLLDRLYWRAAHQPERIAYQFLADQPAAVAQSDLTVWTYRDLFLQTQQVAQSILTVFGEKCGENTVEDASGQDALARQVLLVYPPGLELVAAFLGCLSAGMVAIPVPPPRRHESRSRWQHILSDAKVDSILTTQSLSDELAPLIQAACGQKQAASIGWIITDAQTITKPTSKIAKDTLHTPLEQKDLEKKDLEQKTSNPADVAFLQYTSGSTSQPKGVMVTHGNLAHNLQQIQQAFGHSEQTRCVIWLPPYHDMGLIGGILQPLYGGYPVTLMSPASFLRRPARWLEAISHFGGTTSGGPNFAYDYCVQKISPADRHKLDLSTWQVAFTGAEPVRSQTLRRFTTAFSGCGFRASAFYPCYGLAEATLLVSGGLPTTAPNVVTLDRQALLGNQAVDVERVSDSFEATEDADRKALVSCGKAVDQQIRIVDPQTGIACKEKEIGEIWLTGESVAAGYWNRERETQQVFQATLPDSDLLFLKTGDLGLLFRDELFVTGRLKDLIVIRGQNYYPQDIEQVVQSAHAGFASVSAAFSLVEDGKEKLIVAQEVTRSVVRSLRKGTIKSADMMAAIRAAVSNEFGIQVGAIALLKPGRIPRTTSGKVQRHRCKALFESDEWDAIAQDGQVQSGQKQEQEIAHSADSEKEQKTVAELLSWLRDYAHEQIDSRQMDERRCLNPGLILDFGNKGLLGMQVPEAYGGLGLGHQATLDIIQQLGAIDLTLALFVGLNNVLGIRPILRYGSDELKAKWLPKLATGRELAAFALTEAGAGSHPVGIAAQALPTAAGWQLQGEKIWSGSAAWAGIINVFVQQVDDAGRPLGITGFAVEKGTPGLKQGPEALTMGMRGMVQNTVLLNQVPVKDSQRLGETGAGMSVAQDAMRYGRLAIAAACAGGMKRCAQLMLRYAQRRQISTGRLIDNPVMLTRLNWLSQATAMVESLVTLMATRLDRSLSVPEDLYAACKIIAPELYWQATDDLVQSLGGRGYIETNLAPQMMRDARVLRVFEGPTEAIAMHLGARTMAQSNHLQAFWTDIEQTEVGQRLSDAILPLNTARQSSSHSEQQSKQRVEQQIERGIEQRTERQMSQYQVGQITAWAIGVAALKHTQAPHASIAWGEQQLDQQIEQALRLSADQTTALSAEQIARRIEDYQANIGCVDPLAAVAGLDEWLQPDPSGSFGDHLGDQRFQAESQLQNSVLSHVGSSAGSEAIAKPTVSRAAAQPEKQLTQWIVAWMAAQLGIEQTQIDPDRAFADYGLDSVMAVELAEALTQHLKLAAPLEATLAWHFPTLSAMVTHLIAVASPKKEILKKQPEEQSKQIAEKDSEKSALLERKPLAIAGDHTAELSQLSEAELAATLSAELAAAKGGNP
ncbi:AMP-binding protein [cf. Phormidesmis sp. LEGE 11477]|uniref:AMP-binding protein n=1 Tax=cf. Phormidesmis sp. LEGE 11477 TaxID=1828680 RepID=UPI00187E1F2D|nr:AMP-binding protein [cf. Phormidesmis sp. LEGE 11477]MBE9060855.1 AMP-binding protein [cf. Phormidesmis sp. LEGE 11477]